MIETWKPVPGYEGHYEVSDLGRVKSLKRGDGLILKEWRARYAAVNLKRSDSLQRVVRIHCLVLEAFVGPRLERLEIRHLNGDHFDNRLNNLRYGTSSENKLDVLRHGTHPKVNKTHCPHGHPYEGANLRITSNGGRACITCSRQRTPKKAAA